MTTEATLIATVAGVVTALGWGTNDWLSARAAKKLSPFEINAALQVINLVLLLVLLWIPGIDMPTLDQWVAIVATGALVTAAYLLMIKALTTGAVGVIVPIANSYPIITLSLAIILAGAVFATGQIVAMLAILAGATLLGYEKNHQKIPLKELHKDTMLAVGAAILWGVAFYILDSVVEEFTWQTLLFCVQVVMTVLDLLLLLIVRKGGTVASLKRGFRTRSVVAIGCIAAVASGAFYLGSAKAGSFVIPTVISAAGPLVASLLGAVVDKEKLGLLKRVGAVTVVAGIVLLNIA